jgi:hypothetical protein
VAWRSESETYPALLTYYRSFLSFSFFCLLLSSIAIAIIIVKSRTHTQIAMKACPYRATFYPKLGSPPEKVNADLAAWLAALQTIVTRMQTFYTEGKYDKGL